MLDLWGRGYSDTPGDLPQDTRLFTSAILLALTSSEICWTGPSSFTLVGYSLGGGISTAFTSFFPRLVSALVLIAPSGLLQMQHISATSKLLYSSGIIPESWVEKLVKARLKDGPAAAIAMKKIQPPPTLPVEEELPRSRQPEKHTGGAPPKIRPEVVARDAVVCLPELNFVLHYCYRSLDKLSNPRSGLAGPASRRFHQGFHFQHQAWANS